MPATCAGQDTEEGEQVTRARATAKTQVPACVIGHTRYSAFRRGEEEEAFKVFFHSQSGI